MSLLPLLDLGGFRTLALWILGLLGLLGLRGLLLRLRGLLDLLGLLLRDVRRSRGLGCSVGASLPVNAWEAILEEEGVGV